MTVNTSGTNELPRIKLVMISVLDHFSNSVPQTCIFARAMKKARGLATCLYELRCYDDEDDVVTTWRDPPDLVLR